MTYARSPAADKLATLLIALALVISILATAGLMSVNSATSHKLRAYRMSATDAPPTGKLLGWNALNDSEWAPRQGPGQKVVLFGVAESGQVGDVEYWRDVASRSLAAEPGTQFVGLCAAGKICNLPSGTEGMLTLLSSMDPIQMHALAAYARRGRALVYLDSALQKALPISDDRQSLAEEIANTASQDAKAGGA